MSQANDSSENVEQFRQRFSLSSIETDKVHTSVDDVVNYITDYGMVKHNLQAKAMVRVEE